MNDGVGESASGGVAGTQAVSSGLKFSSTFVVFTKQTEMYVTRFFQSYLCMWTSCLR